MFEDENFTSDVLRNPVLLQQKVLMDIQNRTRGEVVIADPNNSFVTVLDANASMISQMMQTQEKFIDEIYPVRATSMGQLYRHMSDYDYRDIVASPASTVVRLYFDRDELIQKAVNFDDNYKRIIIPDETTIKIGTRVYSIYYPIDIRINIRTENFYITYDTSVENPLFSLASNEVTFYTYEINATKFLQIDLPVYQFVKRTYNESLTSITGFNNVYNYPNKFMASRVLITENSRLKEIAYTLSEDVYDRDRPTARLKILSDLNQVQITIPQIYITNSQIGSAIVVEIYTTEGEIDIPITANEVRDMQISFFTANSQISVYSSLLAALNTIIISTNNKRIIGGSNGLDFYELKKRVVNRSLGISQIPITPLDLENFINDHGFQLTKYKDTVTHRTYYANKKLLKTDNTPVPVTIGNIQITPDIIANSRNIIEYTNDRITILPTCIFRYNTQSTNCSPLDDDDITAITQLESTPSALVRHLNNNFYTRQPFHVVLYTRDRYPHAKTFNLMTPFASQITFVQENIYATAQMVVSGAEVMHNNSGTGGFTIRLGVTKTKLEDVSEADIAILLFARDRSGSRVYKKATYVQDTDLFSIYDVDIPTSYEISDDNHIRVTMNSNETTTVETDLPLEVKFDIHMLINNTHVIPQAQILLNSDSLRTSFSTWAELLHQTMNVTFGKDLSTSIFNKVNVVWSAPVYATYEDTEYQTYENDIYETDASGVPIATVTGSGPTRTVTFNKLHEAGNQILDVNDNPIPINRGGFPVVKDETKRDEKGVPVVLQDRTRNFYIEAMMLDGRIYSSNNKLDEEFLETLPRSFVSYVDTVDRLESQLIEETNLYLQPVRTIGTSRFSVGSGEIIERNLGLGFNLIYYVRGAIFNSETAKETIKTTSINVIAGELSKEVISVTNITKNLREILGSTIESIDMVGLKNSDGSVSTIQTLIPTIPNTSPMIDVTLIVNQDNTLDLVSDVTFEFKKL